MTTTLAWEHAYDSVKQSFLEDGIACDHVFGWRTPAQHAVRARIAWVPGDPSEAVGASNAPRNPGGVPRALASLGELFTVYISGQDPSAPENERKQYHRARLLRNVWFRAMHRVAHGNFALRSEVWVNTKSERRYGATLRIVCELQSPVLDMIPDELGIDNNEIVDAHAIALAENTNLSAELDVVLDETLDQTPVPVDGIPPIVVVDDDGEDDGGAAIGGAMSTANKQMPCLVTQHDGDLACDIAVQHQPTPGAFISAVISGWTVTNIGNGTRVGCVLYFSGDGGLTARAWGEVMLNDTIHFNGSVAGAQLDTSDVMDLIFEESGA